MHARRNCRDCRDCERLPEVREAHLAWALITLMTRRLTAAAAVDAAPVTTRPERNFDGVLYNRVECHVR